MELSNDFRVGVPVAEAWKVLTDVERIAPLLPGAQLQEVDGDQYKGTVKVKVGPITAQYKGTARFAEMDEAAGRVVLAASGRDARGQGNADATITALLEPDGDSTKVTVLTDLTVTGKVAQFGRGVLADISAKLLGQFAAALEADLAREQGEEAPQSAEPAIEPPAGDASETGAAVDAAVPDATAGEASEISSPAAAVAEAAQATGPRRIDSPEAEPVDLVALAGGATLKRAVAPIGAALLVLALLLRGRRSRRR